jgi:hypothetical protein
MLTQSSQVNLDLDNFFWEIDHILLFTESISNISILQEFGLHCSKQVVHHLDQGTASVVIFFENIYIELVWIENRDIVKQCTEFRGLDILTHSNWQQTGASPFGIGLRSKPEKTKIKSQFEKRKIKKQNINFPAKFSSENLSQIEEPVFFLVPDKLALTSWLDCSFAKHQQLITHPLGVKKLTKINVGLDTNKKLTNTIRLLEQNEIVSIKTNTAPLLELTFDNYYQDRAINLQPLLPICIKF